MSNLKIKKVRGKWWIVGDADAGPMGPYDAKAEADDDRRGMQRFNKHWDEPGFITSDESKRIL